MGVGEGTPYVALFISQPSDARSNQGWSPMPPPALLYRCKISTPLFFVYSKGATVLLCVSCSVGEQHHRRVVCWRATPSARWQLATSKRWAGTTYIHTYIRVELGWLLAAEAGSGGGYFLPVQACYSTIDLSTSYFAVLVFFLFSYTRPR